MPFRPRIGFTIALLAALLFAACASDAQDTAAPTDPTPTPNAPATAAATSEPAPDLEPSPAPLPEPSAPAEPTTQATPAPATSTPVASPTPLATSVPGLAGDPWDFLVPPRHEKLAVVGVAFDDILEVHAGPGENTPLVGTLDPLDDAIRSAGEGRSLPASIWWRVTFGDIDGWVGSRFISRLGVTLDITSRVVESTGTRPSAETMLELGMIVADTRASDDPPSSVVVSAAPTVGDLGEIIIDVVGFPDDAVQGERLHIFGQPTEGGEGFSLMAVEATVMCRRGVTQDGLCL